MNPSQSDKMYSASLSVAAFSCFLALSERPIRPADAMSPLIECTRIPLDVLPTREGECNYTHGTIQIYDGDGFFLVIINGTQHRIER